MKKTYFRKVVQVAQLVSEWFESTSKRAKGLKKHRSRDHKHGRPQE